MRVLVTNITCRELSGTVTFSRELALELRRQGHEAAIFSTAPPEFRDELRAAGVRVSTRLSAMPAPDIIHGHHGPALFSALHHWPNVPAIWVCHDHLGPYDATPQHPSIRRHFGVSRVCVQRLVDEGVASDDAGLLLNPVDTTRFVRRRPLSARPARAAVLSNYAADDTHLPAVREACHACGLELTVAGIGAGQIVARPETLLGEQDLVFAKGRAAIEALCSGAAVILCDATGLGPMVTPGNLGALRPMNFGFEALTRRVSAQAVLEEVLTYDVLQTQEVSRRMRELASIETFTMHLVNVYRDVIESRTENGHRRRRMVTEHWRQRLALRSLWLWWLLPPALRRPIRRVALPRLPHRGIRPAGPQGG